MKRLYNVVGTCSIVAMLAACRGVASLSPATVPPSLAGGPASHGLEASIVGPQIHTPAYKTLYSFGDQDDGRTPEASLIDVDGVLYGTTYGGGAYGYYGTAFSISTRGVERVIHSFGSGTDGANPNGGLIDVNGTLYGTTENGGAYSGGTVFRISSVTGIERVLHSFGNGSDGANPIAGLKDVDGALYGTTYQGGAYGNGTLFRISQSGSEHVLHSFGNEYDGANPLAGLIYSNGRFYGTTLFGGNAQPYAGGVVFSASTSGAEKVLHNFGKGSDGAYPWAGLTSVNGKFYGTTESGGAHKAGTVYSISTTGSEKVVYSFSGFDGKYPYAGLIEVDGTLFGTTFAGGHFKCDRGAPCGTVFRLSTSGTETVLHTFGHRGDGTSPYASLLDVRGTLYGTTSRGGAHNHNKGGDGTIFALTL